MHACRTGVKVIFSLVGFKFPVGEKSTIFLSGKKWKHGKSRLNFAKKWKVYCLRYKPLGLLCIHNIKQTTTLVCMYVHANIANASGEDIIFASFLKKYQWVNGKWTLSIVN